MIKQKEKKTLTLCARALKNAHGARCQRYSLLPPISSRRRESPYSSRSFVEICAGNRACRHTRDFPPFVCYSHLLASFVRSVSSRPFSRLAHLRVFSDSRGICTGLSVFFLSQGHVPFPASAKVVRASYRIFRSVATNVT